MIDASTEVANMEVFQRYVDEYQRQRKSLTELSFKRGLSRGQIWQPRYTAHCDYVVGRWVYRLSRTKYQVAFFEVKDYFRLPPGNAVKTTMLFILSDAYFGTGNMAIKFLGPRHSGTKPSLSTGYETNVPREIVELCASFGLRLGANNELSDREGRLLYIHLSGLSDLIGSTRLDAFDAALVRNRGIWKSPEIRSICKYALSPASLLLGDNRARYGYGLPEQHDRNILLYMLMREQIVRVLRRLDFNPYRTLQIDPKSSDLGTFRCSLGDSLEFANSLGAPLFLEPQEWIEVHLFPLPVLTLEIRMREFLATYREHRRHKMPLILVCPSDIKGVFPELYSEVANICKQPRTACFILEDNYSDLVRELRDRLSRASSTLRAGPGIVDD